MIDVQESLTSKFCSIVSLFLYFLLEFKKCICMALSHDSPLSSFHTLLRRGWSSLASVHEDYPKKRPHGMMICGEEKFMQEDLLCKTQERGQESSGVLITQGLDSSGRTPKLRKRPASLVVPQICPADLLIGCEMGSNIENRGFEVEGKGFFLASKKGRRNIMEDGYGVMIDILGNPKQAFFAVIDGHGGRAASDYVAKNLGKNIVKSLEYVVEAEDHVEQAIREGYSVTDKGFLSQGVNSGACASSVLLKDGELHVANVGDCRVVLSKKGVANPLTNDHRPCREDERFRIESSGGFVHCRNGVWRVQGSLAISRAIGDLHLKEWIISEPEFKKLPLTSDCEFLIMASDGLWDKVNDQEAVDVVLRDKNSIESCKKLIDISFNRGNIDDITVMVINLQRFMPTGS